MRDLASRLRTIVRQDHGGGAPSPMRELTYEIDSDGPARDPERIAADLGGALLEAHRGCIVVDRVWEFDAWHGRRSIGSFTMRPDAPIALFDSRAGTTPGWADRIVFFDVETTGLSGGAGTIAFLAGCGWFDADTFRVRQFVLGAPSGERAMLDALAQVFQDASLLVTFNGRTFDVPLMETRWAFHRSDAPTDGLPHFDMLPPARRLWGRRDESLDRPSCSLTSLERSVLGFHRIGDVPGFEIPARYFHFLRTGDGRAVADVLEHNRLDLLSLAGVMSHALTLAADGPESCPTASEQLALGRLYERAGDRAIAVRAYELAAAGGEREIQRSALARLAILLGREDRHAEAAEAWQGVLDRAPRHGALSAIDRHAIEALAIHHEHRARDLSVARQFAARLESDVTGRARAAATHRLGRIERKLDAKTKPSPPLDWES